MGQNPFKKKLNTLTLEPDSPIASSTTCPNCGKSFSSQATYFQLNSHIDFCLLMNQNLQQKMKKPSFTEIIYEKVKIDQTTYQWIKKNSKAFVNKYLKFMNQVEKKKVPWTYGSQYLKINNQNVLMSSLYSITEINLFKQLKISFQNQTVNDAGGLLRQWMHMLCLQAFDPNFGNYLSIGLFFKCTTEQNVYRVNNSQEIDIEFMSDVMKLLGLVIGKALMQRVTINCYLNKCLIRHILSQKIDLNDMYFHDREMYKSFKYILENDIENEDFYFCVYKQEKNNLVSTNLIENGSTIKINNSNKKSYIQKCIQYYTYLQNKQLIDKLCQNIWKLVGKKNLENFTPEQFQMILNGAPYVDLANLKKYTQYKGQYHQNHKIIQWFWTILNNFSQQQLRKFMLFCTGSQRPPIFGYSVLESNRNHLSKFCIESCKYDKINSYPKAHSCFNRLVLPKYYSKQQMKKYLNAICDQKLEGLYGLD